MKQLKNLKFLNNKIIQSNGKDNKTDSDIKLSDPKYNQQEHSKELTATTTDEISDIEEPIDDLKELLRRARRIDKISSRTSCAEIIFNKRLISKEQLRKAIKIQEESGGYFHQVLADMAIIPKKSILEIAAEGWGIGGYLDLLETRNVDPEVVKLIPESKARQILGIPVFINETRLSVAMANPLDIFIVDDIKRILRMKGLDYEIDTLLALPKDIEKKLEEIYGLNDEFVHSILEEIQGDNITVESVEEVEQEDDFDIARSLEAAQKGPVINLVNAIFLNAVKMSATDIHIEPFRKRTVLRFRIDGSMQEIPKIPIPKARHAAVASRIKIMAGCDISERRLPQDGRIQFTAAGKEYDVRVSVIPTASFGESIVMRIADRGSTSLSLTQLGFSTGNLKIFEDAISKPHGIILVTGPTGSGKTTTLYSALNTINKPEIKILTVENPVERHLEGAVQIQVKSEIGLDFAAV
ncbi:hypothetical protein FJZ33_06330, partial [Candidatus Poribacteria bacterium]|nr:hypothetical protein [Candidatus Poribacteria bacterium]